MSATNRRRGQDPYAEVYFAVIVAGAAVVLVFAAWVGAWVGASVDGTERPPANAFRMALELAVQDYEWPGRSAYFGFFAVLAAVTAVIGVAVMAYLRREVIVIDRATRYLAKPRDLRAFGTAGARRSAERLGMPPDTAPGVYLGRTVGGNRDLWGSWEDMHVDIWGPRTGKTASRAIPNIVAAPGAVVVTSNKRDVVDATRGVRETKGDVWIFDPQSQAGAPPSWYWNPLAYVGDSIVRAIKITGRFSSINRPAHARSDSYFEPAAEDLIANLLLAASLDDKPITHVYAWLTRPTDETPVRVLRANGHHISAESVEAIATSPELQRAGVYGTATQIMQFLTAPTVTEWVSPGSNPDRPQFDHLAFVKSTDTIYLLSEETNKAAAPLVLALTAALAEAAENEGIRRKSGRLPVPMLFVLDEAANVCPWGALPDKYSHFGSRGIVMMTILQSWAQGAAAWGDKGMQKLWGAANVRVYGGGVSDTGFLGALSKVSGAFEPRTTGMSVKFGDRRSYSIGSRPEPVLDEADLASMPRGRAFVQISGAKPVLIKTVPWWRTKHADAIRESLERYEPADETAPPLIPNAVYPRK